VKENPTTCAILCPGPSLPRFWLRPVRLPAEYDMTIAVNRAAEAWPCDFWAYQDEVAAQIFEPLGLPKHFDAIQTMAAQTIWNISLPDVHLSSIAGALFLAEIKGARIIDVFGADFRGTADWDGPPKYKPNRNAERWARTRKSFNSACERMRARGVTITRRLYWGRNNGDSSKMQGG